MTQNQKQPEELTTSTGVVFRLRQPSAWALTDVNRQMNATEPQPPVVHIADKGRDEPNEADPNYLTALKAHSIQRSERLYEVVVATGTEIVSVPDGFPTPEDDAWRNPLLAVGVGLSGRPERRYVEWVKYKAAPSDDDWLRLYSPLLRKIGTSEEDVAEATQAFRGLSQRGADTEPAARADGPDGD